MIPKIIAVDFDGTLCSDRWPAIGEANYPLICHLIKEKAAGTKLILWTCRTNERLKEAVAWCNTRGLFFDTINRNLPEIIEIYGDSIKVFAHQYFDDKAVWVKMTEEA